MMGREVRRVPAGWEHPKDRATGRYKPLFSGEQYAPRAQEFLDMAKRDGLQAAIDWCGEAPDVNDYMPNWPESECTHLMMYENTSEGTPISPAFDRPEDLARWLADNGASAFGSMTANYDEWLAMVQDGSSVSAVYTPETGLISGVEAATIAGKK